jgi:acetolactate synthase small subunit
MTAGAVRVCPACGARAAAPGPCVHDGHAVIADDDPLLGAEVGGYRLARRLGRGGMGVVYLGVMPSIEARVAIKIVAAALEPASAERFVREARAANRIRHDGVVGVFAAGLLDDGRPYLIMELVHGEALAARFARGPVPPRALCAWLRQVADVFRARIIDVSADSLVLELTGGTAKLDRLLEVLEPFGVLEMARTGTLAMARGEGPGRTAAPLGRATSATAAESQDIAYSV